ncbi:hypothetical protein LK996_02255 [Lysobacter sp. A6]|uniref:HTH cro/C1-type domain-containing protein n=1 Tax=Noviluteimonas lactosilytica TaxID=2888523 RepID=A0ABS8JED2_9GAMM|nr:hypothetical protein [Lysobacter lactosilyticus]MCC8361907.1 hypothetical protein [Lysobacter lactosilyticus]
MTTPFPAAITSTHQHDNYLALMDWLLDRGAIRRRHALHGLLQTSVDLVHDYEQRHWRMRRVSAAEMLRFLMEQHGLQRCDLRDEIGPRRLVTEILDDKRELTAHQVAALAKRFGVSPAVFLD